MQIARAIAPMRIRQWARGGTRAGASRQIANESTNGWRILDATQFPGSQYVRSIPHLNMGTGRPLSGRVGTCRIVPSRHLSNAFDAFVALAQRWHARISNVIHRRTTVLAHIEKKQLVVPCG